MNVPAHAKIAVGVVVERRKAQSPWIDFTWKPVTALAGLPEASPWTTLSQDGDGTTFYAGGAEIELYRTETTNYRDNLGSGAPMLWVALRPTGVEPPYEIFAVTADPAEGEAWTEAGGDLVGVRRRRHGHDRHGIEDQQGFPAVHDRCRHAFATATRRAAHCAGRPGAS